MKKSVPANQINRSFSSKVILPYSRSKTLSKAESAATSFVDVPDSNSMPDQPLLLSSSGSSIFTGGGFAGAGAADDILVVLRCGGVRLALHRARSYFLQDPCCAAVFVCAVAVAPLFARSTDVLKKRLHKRANSSYCFARASVGVPAALAYATQFRFSMSRKQSQLTTAVLTGSEETLHASFLAAACYSRGVLSFCPGLFASASEASVAFARALHAHCTRATTL